jgi:hypothetical protein
MKFTNFKYLLASFALGFLFAGFNQTVSAQTCDQPTNKTVSGTITKEFYDPFAVSSSPREPFNGVSVDLYTYPNGSPVLYTTVVTDSMGNYTADLSQATSCSPVQVVPYLSSVYYFIGNSTHITYIGYSTAYSNAEQQSQVNFHVIYD